jgi:hypothetical protein
MSVRIDWQTIDSEDDGDGLWDEFRVLYAYAHRRQIHYMGKAWGTTVRGRWRARDKRPVLDHLERALGIDLDRLGILLGVVRADQRLTRELLADLESLLILRLDPLANIRNTRSRSISRPGLVVSCVGDWPLQQKRYVDTGPAVR